MMVADKTQPPLLLDRYEHVRELGAGGVGVVYQVRDPTNGAMYALKVLQDAADDDDERERFLRESELVQRLKSPHTVGLVESGLHEGVPYMVLELLEDELAEHGALSPDTTRHIFLQILDAVAEAHEWGIVHRDLKPANIMLMGESDRPEVKVLDFGTAGLELGFKELGGHKHITMHGELRGTPNYMAPEQVTSFAEARVETDVYALGLILLECLTGEMAVQGPTIQAVLFSHLSKPVVIPDAIASGPFGSVLERALYKEPEERFPIAGAMLAEIQRVSEDGLRREAATIETEATRVELDISDLFEVVPEALDNDPTPVPPLPAVETPRGLEKPNVNSLPTMKLSSAHTTAPSLPSVVQPQPSRKATPTQLVIVVLLALACVLLAVIALAVL